MAKWRALWKSISQSRKLKALHRATGDFGPLLYSWMQSHGDDFGRMQGDAETVKDTIIPWHPAPVKDFETALRVMHRVGLIYRYGPKHAYLAIFEWDAHQPGLHKRVHSGIPNPPPGLEGYAYIYKEGAPGTSGNFRELPGNSGLDRDRDLDRDGDREKSRSRARDPESSTAPVDNLGEGKGSARASRAKGKSEGPPGQAVKRAQVAAAVKGLEGCITNGDPRPLVERLVALGHDPPAVWGAIVQARSKTNSAGYLVKLLADPAHAIADAAMEQARREMREWDFS